jgi:phospholipase/carboxylesterase
MISIQIALKKKKQISCLIGYSGKIINQKHLSDNIHSKPKIFLMHGANDTLVPPTHLLEAKEYLTKHGLKIKTKMFKDCEHRIPVEGVSLGLGFLKKNLL